MSADRPSPDRPSPRHSIATTRGDAGQTGLAGGIRVSKSALRVEAYGSVDELNAALGLARAACADAVIAELTRGIQQELFKVGSALATAPESPKPQVPIDAAMVDRLTAEVHRIEAVDGVLSDWSLSGDLPVAAAFNFARTVCRRAERAVVRLGESGAALQPGILAYLNRLSDLLYLCARQLEHDAGINASLRAQTGKGGNRWSRAW
jgi:cob(I)alamin adenosyltransferase